MTEWLLSAGVAVGLVAGKVFGHLVTGALNERDRRTRARSAWQEAWSRPRG